MGIITTLVQLILISISPVLELRAAIPYGILVKDWPWFVVFAVCSVANFLVAPLIYLFLDKFIHLLFFIGWFERIYKKYVEKAQHRAQKYVDKYGHYGVMFFIGIPLPGSGVDILWLLRLAVVLWRARLSQELYCLAEDCLVFFSNAL
jgi:uncharacterized membrane protein